jgi:hypothetical protein
MIVPEGIPEGGLCPFLAKELVLLWSKCPSPFLIRLFNLIGQVITVLRFERTVLISCPSLLMSSNHEAKKSRLYGDAFITSRPGNGHAHTF